MQKISEVDITVIILVFNEKLHIERCLNSIKKITTSIIVVDSYSTDNTVEICKSLNVKVYQNEFINQANQFQWALDNCLIDTQWVMRLDADEYLTDELVSEIFNKLNLLSTSVTGIILKRRVYFMNTWIKNGGYYPTKLLRIWRNGFGSVEQRWMDEHIKLSEGISIEFFHDFIDHNLNNISWWTQKHNDYSTREAVDILNKKYRIFNEDSINKNGRQQDQKKRWYKDNLYINLPKFIRAFGYYIYRYVFLFGFLDGYPGIIWHFLQGFWYRFLVDAKIYQIEYLAKEKNKTIVQILEEDFNFKI